MKKIASFLREKKKTVLSFFIAAIVVDTFFFKKSSDYFTFGILILYLFFLKIFQIKSKSTFLMCLALLIVMFIGYLFSKTSILTEKAAVWFVLFLIVGVIQQWKE